MTDRASRWPRRTARSGCGPYLAAPIAGPPRAAGSSPDAGGVAGLGREEPEQRDLLAVQPADPWNGVLVSPDGGSVSVGVEDAGMDLADGRRVAELASHIRFASAAEVGGGRPASPRAASTVPA